MEPNSRPLDHATNPVELVYSDRWLCYPSKALMDHVEYLEKLNRVMEENKKLKKALEEIRDYNGH